MAETVASKELRELAERHRTIARLYDRLASQEELAESMRQYGAKLGEVESDVTRLRAEIRSLERDLARPEPGELPAFVSTPRKMCGHGNYADTCAMRPTAAPCNQEG